ncbi:MAG TPA: hypothetical protein VMD92_08455 [Acidobacteriaceae bacterium]|jgi:hypothetical protein|nr:hypothetical protein [Acidobacteriaceae bacterium]
MRILTAWIRAIVSFFSEILFGCSHNRLTRPFTIDEETYMVCLDCGRQIYYSAQEMRPLSAWEVRRMKAARAGEVKVVPIPAGVPQLMPAGEHKSNVAA